MLKALRFVRGAVAKKDFHPVLTHFRISQGTITGYNGELALCSPIALDFASNPQAFPLIKVMNACEDTIAIHQTPTGRLSVKSGSFKAFIDCTEETFPQVIPTGQEVLLSGPLLPALRLLAPLTATDASRAWAQGVLFRGCSAYATNNVVLAEHWLGFHIPHAINIPKPAIAELLRINEEPERLLLDEATCTFMFSDKRWLRTNLYSAAWPDVARVLDVDASPLALPEGFWPCVEKMLPFTGKAETLWLLEGGLHTHQADTEGTHIGLATLRLTKPACFNIRHLLLLKEIISEIDFSSYPKPCHFFGNNLRGAIIGKIE